MTIIPVEFTATASLESAHAAWTQVNLPESLHGHNWQVTAKWSFHSDSEKGLSDRCISDLKTAISELEHTNLNTVTAAVGKNVTAESVAYQLFKILSNCSTEAVLISVNVEEEVDCIVEYSE